jgi:hypothetical protein
MTPTPPAPFEPTGAPRAPVDVPWEALEDLAAGALPPAEATALRARLATEPGWAAAYARVAALEHALALEGLYPFPAALAARIVDDAIGVRRLGAGALAVRVAAAVVLAVGAWTALLGRAPAPPTSDVLPEWTQAPIALPGERALAVAPAVPAPAAPWAAAGALALVAGGVVLARRWGTGLPPAGEAGRA